MRNQNRKDGLKERLIDYGVRIINASRELPESRAYQRIATQLLISGTSPASRYPEALRAESKGDCINKIKISLKDLRESKVWLNIIIRAKLFRTSIFESLVKETDELIAVLRISHESL